MSIKKIVILLSLAAVSFSCQKKAVIVEGVAGKYASFGESITETGALSKEEMFAQYAGLHQGDTVKAKFLSRIDDVCSKKGCWMNLDLVNNDKVFVKFKDYAFFMPLNSKGNQAIVNGKAFLSVETVDELKHYAKDAGKPQAEIDSIAHPKTSYAFLADGVLIKK